MPLVIGYCHPLACYHLQQVSVPPTLPNPRILLIDIDDSRRATRVRLLQDSGYDVELRADHHSAAQRLGTEVNFDLVVFALHQRGLDEALVHYNDLRQSAPTLPILLLLDQNIFLPNTSGTQIRTGLPKEFLENIAQLLAGSKHISVIETEQSAAKE